MAEITLNYVNSYRDIRNGKMRHVFRRRGYKKLLKGRPGSAEFMDHYAALLASSEDVAAPIGASKIKPGSIDALVVRYLQHDFFTKGLAKATRDARRPILDNFRQCRTPSGFRYGENRIATIQRKNISDALAGKTPVMQKVWLKAIRHLIAFAIDQGDCKTDPTIGIKTTRPPKTSGHVTWGDAQIEQYRERHTIGTMARLALELMLNIAARRHDAHLIGRQHLKNGRLSWRPSKTSQSTGKVLTIRVLPELQAALDAMPRNNATFLLTELGKPFASPAAFGNKFADWCDLAGLKPAVCDDGKVRNYRAHGLRKAACKRLAHAGCTAMEIMAVSGHTSLAEVQKYIVAVEQDQLAEAAMVKLGAKIKTGTGM